jgi:hypothetical protein
MSEVGRILLLALSYLWAYWQIFRGAGKGIGALVGIIYLIAGYFLPRFWLLLVTLFLLIGIFAFIRQRFQRVDLEDPEMVFEGGGIRRGLSPIEVGHYLGVTRAELLGLSLLELLNKGLIEIRSTQVVVAGIFEGAEKILNATERRKARKAQARQIGKELTDLEDNLLETLIQYQDGGLSISAFQVWEDQLSRQAHYRVGGFDVAQTLDYYREYITHRVNGVAAGHFSAESLLPWLRLAMLKSTSPGTSETARQILAGCQPSWLPEGWDLIQWLDSYLANLPA